jgi:hypothetical protein
VTKTCTKCRVEKPISAFNNYAPPRGGTYSHCKECRAVNEKAYRAANADDIAAKRKAYNLANPGLREAQHRKYYAANADAINERIRAAYAADPEAKRAKNKANNKESRVREPEVWAGRRLKELYGMTLDDYARMLESQGGLCANSGCFNPPPADRRFDMDHDHACCPGKKSCGKCVRGLLCRQCNHALGMLRDDVKRIRGLADYLERIERPE